MSLPLPVLYSSTRYKGFWPDDAIGRTHWLNSRAKYSVNGLEDVSDEINPI
jgi:hypothetical protein